MTEYLVVTLMLSCYGAILGEASGNVFGHGLFGGHIMQEGF